MKKDVAVKESAQPVAAVLPTDLMMASQTSGFENVKSTDTAIPFLAILQSLNPQVKKGNPAKIHGAEEGMFFNNVTLEVMQSPLIVIPCAFQKAFVEWIPREQGGGFVAQHTDEAILAKCARNDKNEDVLPNGNSLVTTAYHFVIIVKPDGKLERVVIAMTRTQLKKSRRWLSQMMSIQMRNSAGKLFRPPMFSHTYEVHSVLEQKDQYSWYGFQIGSPKPIEDIEVYTEAVRFNSEVMGGSVKVSQPVDERIVDQGVDTSESHM